MSNVNDGKSPKLEELEKQAFEMKKKTQESKRPGILGAGKKSAEYNKENGIVLDKLEGDEPSHQHNQDRSTV